MKTHTLAFTILFGLPLALPGQTLSQQAQSQANSFWNQRLTRCGDTAYVAFKSGEVDAFKSAQIVVQAQPLNEADRLNGWEWKGVTGFTATATRIWVAHETLGVYGPLGWQPWVPGTGPAGMFGIYTATVEKLHGAWRVVPNPVFPLSEMKAFDCSQMPPERFDPNSALVQNEYREAACRRFMSAGTPINGSGNSSDQLASLRYWMTTIKDRSGQDVPGPGVEPKTCRDDNGDTVLMKLAYHQYPPLDAIQYLLGAGVDVNARNFAGETAMSLAEKPLAAIRQGGFGSIGDASATSKVISLLQNAMSPSPTQTAIVTPTVKKLKKKTDAREAPMPVSEPNCFGFDPNNVAVLQFVGGSNVVINGANGQLTLMSFGHKEAEANRAVQVIKFYGLATRCYAVENQIEYWLTASQQPPQGAMTGEDCIPFNPSTLHAENRGDISLLLDERSSMLSFKRADDVAGAISLIRRYGFTQHCFAGRAQPPMQYFRK
jgi:hypothetical protein